MISLLLVMSSSIDFALTKFMEPGLESLIIKVVLYVPIFFLTLLFFNESAKDIGAKLSGRLYEIKELSAKAPEQLGQLQTNVDIKSAIDKTRAEVTKSQADAKKQLAEIEALVKRAEECRLSLEMDGRSVKTMEEISKFLKTTGRIFWSQRL